jgi:hypothetical protein
MNRNELSNLATNDTNSDESRRIACANSHKFVQFVTQLFGTQ